MRPYYFYQESHLQRCNSTSGISTAACHNQPLVTTKQNGGHFHGDVYRRIVLGVVGKACLQKVSGIVPAEYQILVPLLEELLATCGSTPEVIDDKLSVSYRWDALFRQRRLHADLKPDPV